MPHIHHDDARKSRGDKLKAMTGQRGEYPPDRAARIANLGASGSAQGDAAKPPAEVFVGAPARQVSNTGKVIGEDD